MTSPTVHILLATYNGEKFLREQLDSIARQTHSAWTLTVSDDGSNDGTLAIVSEFAKQISQEVSILHGSQNGSTYNFFHLVQHVPTHNRQDLYAFCDQDDVWLDEKLAKAVRWHNSHTDQAVRLYCGRTKFVNEQLKPIGLSPGISLPPSFGNALVQNIASGNTMVMSHAVLMAQKQVQAVHSVWHDWTTYLIATAMGGLVWFDDEPSLLYRQHASNVIGSNDGLTAQILRLWPLFKGRFKLWTDVNIEALQDLRGLTSSSTQQLLRKFVELRCNKFPWTRLRMWGHTKIRRQTLASNLTLALALLFGLV